MSNTLKDHPSPRKNMDRDGLKKNNNDRPSRASVRSKISHLEYDLDELDYEDDDMVNFEKM